MLGFMNIKDYQGSRPAGFIQTTGFPNTSTGQCNKAKSLVTESVCVSSGIACAG